MRGDFSKISFNEFKHYVGVLLQQGKVQLDADWNEQTLIINDVIKKISQDAFGDFHCIGESFRIGKGIILDNMQDSSDWQIESNDEKDIGLISFSDIHRPREHNNSTHEKGSLLISHAQSISKEFDSLNLSRLHKILLKIKLESSKLIDVIDQTDLFVKLVLQTKNGDSDRFYTCSGNISESIDAGGFQTVEFTLDGEHCKMNSQNDQNDLDLSQIHKITINWSMKNPICLGHLEAEPFIPIVTTDPMLRTYDCINVNESQHQTNLDIETTFQGLPSIIKPEKLNEIIWQFPTFCNFKSIDAIRFSSDSLFKPTIFLITELGDLIEIEGTELTPTQTESFQLHHYYFDVRESRNLPESEEISFERIKSIGIRNLPLEEFRISNIMGEINLENDFFITGCGTYDKKPGRMYIEGTLCQKEFNETYHGQSDYPDAKPMLLTYSEISNPPKKISYFVYADVWQRGITHIEDPELREKALGGPDTATRIKTICQVKLREIPNDESLDVRRKITKEEIKKLTHKNDTGRMSTVVSNNHVNENQKLDYVGLDNRLYLVKIHDSGDKNENPASFKWSVDNASTCFSVKSIGPYNVSLKSMGRSLDNVFKIGDIIEIIDDRQELSEFPRGELRRITNIDLDKQLISWDSEDKTDPAGIDYLHDEVVMSYFESFHPKIIKWDGIKKVNINGDVDSILLSDDGPKKTVPDNEGVKIRFTNGNFVSGDYWNFYTRAITGEIEKLSFSRPDGPKHTLFGLAILEKEEGQPIKIIDDLRKK